MRVLLINPPVTVFRGGTNPRIYMPLGLLYIAAQLQKEGHEVELFDALIKAKILKIKYSETWHLGETWDEIAKHIQKSNPQFVGITSMFSSQSKNVKMVAAITKQVSRSILTVVGGAHPSAYHDDMLRDKNIDFVVVGEGEFVMSMLLDAMIGRGNIRSIPGLCTYFRGKKNENLVPSRIKNLDDLPLPAYHLYDMERYFFLQSHGFCARPLGYGKREISVITSRGCPYNCVFCSIHPVMGREWRANSAEHVLNHIEFLKKNYKIDFVHFEDDNFSLDRKRFESILDGISLKKLNIRWEPSNGLRADTLDEALIKKAINSGCQEIAIAIESGVQRVLDEIIDKQLSLTQIIKIAKICKRLGIDLYAYYLVGLPGETLQDVKETLVFAKKMMSNYFIAPHISFVAPIWGSRLYDICKENDYLVEEVTPERLAIAYDSHGKGLIKTNKFSPEDLKCILSRYNRLFVLIAIFNVIRRPHKLLRYFIIIMRNPHLLRRLVFNR